MKLVGVSLPLAWWVLPVAMAIGVIIWQRRRWRLSPLRIGALAVLLVAVLDPVITVQPQSVEKAEYNLQVLKPRVLLVEYGGGKTFLGTVLGQDSPASTDIISPDDLPMVSDSLSKYDIVTLHATKNLQIYSDYLSDWHSFPYRSRLESVFSDYGVVFDNGTQALPKDLDNYGLIVLAGSDIKSEDSSRLTDYVSKGGRVVVLLHVGGGKTINPPGTIDPYCILYHHPPYGDRPFPEEWLQRNMATWLMDQMGIRAMENIACIYGKMVVQDSNLSVLPDIYGAGKLYPDVKVDGKEFDKLDWTTAFVGYDPAWQPLLKIDTKYSEEPMGHGTPITVNVQGQAVALARQYGKGKIFVYGFGAVNYGTFGIPPSIYLAAAPYVGSELSYDATTSQALANYVTGGGNFVVVGPSLPKSAGNVKLTNLLPVNISGPQVTEDTKAVFRNPSHPVLSAIGAFNVSHYRVSGLKANGEALAVDGKNNPVLATSYYGQGKVVYFLPEIPAEVTVNNTAAPDFWRRLVSWLAPSDTSAPGRNTSLPVRTGKQVPVTIRVSDDRGQPVGKAQVSSQYQSADGVSGVIKLKEASAGVYTGALPLEAPGDYQLDYSIRAGTNIRPAAVKLTATSPELGGLGPALWKAITFLDGYHSTTPMIVRFPLWQVLVALGVCLLCADWIIGLLRGTGARTAKPRT